MAWRDAEPGSPHYLNIGQVIRRICATRPPWTDRSGDYHHISGLVLERRNSSALAMELRFSCANPSMYCFYRPLLTLSLALKVNAKFDYGQRVVYAGFPSDGRDFELCCHTNKYTSPHRAVIIHGTRNDRLLLYNIEFRKDATPEQRCPWLRENQRVSNELTLFCFESFRSKLSHPGFP